MLRERIEEELKSLERRRQETSLYIVEEKGKLEEINRTINKLTIMLGGSDENENDSGN